MIVYNLKCAKNHNFEAWFPGSADYEEQRAEGKVSCPLCGSTKVDKGIMAPNVARSSGRGASRGEEAKPETPGSPRPGQGEVYAGLKELRRQIEANCEYVGERLPEEARKIHYRETDAKGIYGEASAEEARSLRDEGIEIRSIPWLPRENS